MDRCRRSDVPCRHDARPFGHIEQLPSGSWRAKVYARQDPLTGREIRFRKTRKTEVEAQIELGRLLELARAGRNPDSGVTVAELLDAYVPVAGWDVSTEESDLGYIRRTTKPALGAKEVRRSVARCWNPRPRQKPNSSRPEREPKACQQSTPDDYPRCAR